MEMSASGAAQAMNLCLSFVPGMVAKAVCELDIPDILAAYDEPLSSLQLAQLLSPPPTRPLHEAAEQLDRLMQCLCAHNVFQAHPQPGADQRPEYSVTPLSRCLQRDAMKDVFLLHYAHQFHDPWHHMAQSVLHDVAPFTATNSMDIWALGAKDPSFNRLYNAGMAAISRFALAGFVQHYDGFQEGVHTIVDVGGGLGMGSSFIAARYPSIKVINFDLPAVISMAPEYPGVQHIGGDMFASIPQADAITMKSVLHDWKDEDCVKILHNCHKALPAHGKLLLVEVVLDPISTTTQSSLQAMQATVDLMMFTHTDGGKERSKKEWAVLLEASKFSITRFINLPPLASIIEASPLIG